jgi:hypothetical protein
MYPGRDTLTGFPDAPPVILICADETEGSGGNDMKAGLFDADQILIVDMR